MTDIFFLPCGKTSQEKYATFKVKLKFCLYGSSQNKLHKENSVLSLSGLAWKKENTFIDNNVSTHKIISKIKENNIRKLTKDCKKIVFIGTGIIQQEKLS